MHNLQANACERPGRGRAQALLALGDDAAVGAEAVTLVAGDGAAGLGFQGLAPYFAPAELRALLEHERRAVMAAIAAAQSPFV